MTDWTNTDYQKVASVIGARTWSTKSANWRGLFDANATVDPLPRPDMPLSDPTVFCVWDIAYTGTPMPTFGVGAAGDLPVRDGLVIVAVWTQKGATRGHALNLFDQLRQAFTGADGGSVVFFPQDAVPQPLQYRGEWAVEVLPIPFMGGVA